MEWKEPPVIKIYEALGAVSDGRVEVIGNTGTVRSSSGNKQYMVNFDDAENAIMTNDNGSYWQGYLGYPAIAYLLQTGILPYDPSLSKLLKGIPWKEINTKFKNNFDATLDHILSTVKEEDRKTLVKYVADIAVRLKNLKLVHLGQKIKPPSGY